MLLQTGEIVILHNAVRAIAGFGIAAVVAAAVTFQRQSGREEGYESYPNVRFFQSDFQ